MSNDVKDILRKYENILNGQIEGEEFSDSNFSRDYEIFREEALTMNMGAYEKLCNSAENILTVKAKDEEEKNYKDLSIYVI